MSRRRFSTILSLIDDLLDRHESKPGARSLIAPIDDDGFANMDLRDGFDEELAALEREGALELIRTGPKTDRRITGARLKDPDLLYRRTGRRPSGVIATQAVAEFRSRPGLPAGALGLIDDVAEAWGRGVSHIGIATGDVRALADVVSLALAVRERLSGALQGEQDFRTFSRLSVGDSKALERNIRQIAAATTRMFPADEEQARLDPDDLLASAGLCRLPQPILIHGDLLLNGQPFPDMPYVGVPTDCVAGVGLRSNPDYILTVENFTSFVRHIREVAVLERALIIYSGGFPSLPTLATIARLSAEARAPTFHWGDMDGGGIRIFRHLERRLCAVGVTLHPHMMDADLLQRVGRPGQSDGRSVGDIEGSAVAALAAFQASSGLVHEQEEFEPRSPLADAPPSFERVPIFDASNIR